MLEAIEILKHTNIINREGSNSNLISAFITKAESAGRTQWWASNKCLGPMILVDSLKQLDSHDWLIWSIYTSDRAQFFPTGWTDIA